MTDDARQQTYWEQEHGHRHYDHPVVKCFATQRVEQIGRWFDLSTISRALDVGCGDGFSTFYMKRRVGEVYGADRSETMLHRHPFHDTGRLVEADVRSLPFDSGSFDLVYGWEVLHHISAPATVVAEMARVSRRYVLVAEPNRNDPAQFAFALADREHRWVLRFSLRYLRRVVEQAGLRVLRSGSGGWIFPNKTPRWFLPLLKRLPYWCPLGITNWVLGEKP